MSTTATTKPAASFRFAWVEAQRNGNAAHAHEHHSEEAKAIAYRRAYEATMRAYGFGSATWKPG